jgi:hypothetical protein
MSNLLNVQFDLPSAKPQVLTEHTANVPDRRAICALPFDDQAASGT